MPTLHHLREREVMFHFTVSAAQAARKDTLNPLPQLRGNDRLVVAPVPLPIPIEIASVDSATQNPMHRGGVYRIATFLKASPMRRASLLIALTLYSPCGVKLEEASNQRRSFSIRSNSSFAILTLSVDVTYGSERRPYALLSFFSHAFSCFFGEVVDVVLREYDLDSVYHLGVRRSGSGVHFVLFNQVDFKIEFLDQIASLQFLYNLSVFSTRTTLQSLRLLKNLSISPNSVRPLFFAVSTSTNSRSTVSPSARPRSRSIFNCAGIENPSFSCSLMKPAHI